MFMRRIEPKPNHALFFPRRKQAEVVIGEAALVSRFRRLEVKHIQLDAFQMALQFGDGHPNPPAKTAEDLECGVDVFLRLQVRRDPASLLRATETWPACASLDPSLTSKYFEAQLSSSLISAVESQVRQVRYLDLLLSGDEKAKLEAAVRDACAKAVESRGFDLLGCRVDVETAEPTADALAHDPALNKEWSTYVERKQNLESGETERKNSHVAKLLELKNAKDLKEKQLDTKSKMDLQEEENKHQAALRRLRNEDLKDAQDAKEKSKPILTAIAKIDDAIQKEKIEFEHARKKREIELQAERDALASQKTRDAEKEQKSHEQAVSAMIREEETRQSAHALDREKHNSELLALQVQRAVMQKEKDSAEAVSILELGRAKSEVERLQTLAARADTIQLSEGLLKALPNVLEKAYQPCQKIGDIRMLVVSGDRQPLQDTKHDGAENGILGTVLTSVSLIPLVREVIEFVKEGAGVMSPAQSSTREKTTMQTVATGVSNAQS